MSATITPPARPTSPTDSVDPTRSTADRPRRGLLLTTFPWLSDRHEAPARLVLIPVGFLPVTLIAVSAFGVAGLRELALYLLVPALALAAGVLLWRPRWARMALWALGAGIVATALYDAYRGSFLALGLMQVDPIPHIGVALHLDPDWVFGYLWRYLGNGGGIAVAFFALGFRGIRVGILYGLFVCSGLLFVLVAAPYGEEMLFPLSLTTVVMAVGGHVIYGAVLGWASSRRNRGGSPAPGAGDPPLSEAIGSGVSPASPPEAAASVPSGRRSRR